MINLFREIRRKFLAEKSFNKYLLYALGEIFLVVIGILLALQVNNWNDERKNNAKADKLKSELLEEFEKDLYQLESKIKIRNHIIKSSLKLLDYIDRIESADTDSIKYYLSFTSFRPTFDPISVEIIDKSAIDLIKNDRLRRLLTAWKVEVLQLREDELNWRDYVVNYRYSYELSQDIGFLRSNQIEFQKNDGPSLFLLQKDSISYVEFKPPKKGIDYRRLIQSKFWDAYCTKAIQLNQDANLNSFTLKERILEIIYLLKTKDD